MADPPHFSLRFLTGDNPVLKLEDDEFLRKHTKVFLRSDASERIWKVKLDGEKLADGWEEFSGDNSFRDGDVLVFSHDGDENFHVSVASRFSSGVLEHASPSYVDTEDDDDDGDDRENEDNAVVKKNQKSEANSCLVTARVTRSSLIKDRLDLSRTFKVLFGEQNKRREIDLANEQGRKWILVLAKNISSGVFYIRQGWSNFCFANRLKEGDLCKFKLVENGGKPVLLLCSQDPEEVDDAVKNCSSGRGKEKNMLNQVSKVKKKKTTPSSLLTLELTPNRYKNGQLYLSSSFIRENGIKKPGEITLCDKDGRKWSSTLYMTGGGGGGNEWFYLRRGWREMCEANGVKVNGSFVLELIWEDSNPMFKFHSKIESKGEGNRRTRKKRACETEVRTVEKTPRIEIEGHRVSRGAKQRSRVSNRFTATISRSRSVSDQVTNVKQSLVDTLNTVRQFRSELETRERNLEASILEIGALGERISGISQILNHKLV